MNPQAQVEGIATNGTDVWLVDAKQDKVFKYTGGASRRFGSQSAASSFKLASSDSNPKGIVTDGTSFWVVDDGTANKVFKYTLAGSSLGSWTIDAANASPTGLTINPVDVSDIWIIDNGTDRVYQYTAAAGRTSGSQNASATFALAAGNTNPQDIADPPPTAMLLAPVPAPPASVTRPSAARPPISAVANLAVGDIVVADTARQPGIALSPPGGTTPAAARDSGRIRLDGLTAAARGTTMDVTGLNSIAGGPRSAGADPVWLAVADSSDDEFGEVFSIWLTRV